MNLDELLRNVWRVEEDNTNGLNIDSSSGTLNWKPSFTLSRDLSKKTVEEVWKDIQQGKKKGDSLDSETYSEMTLEDFLVKAGVVDELADVDVSHSHPQWMVNYQLPQQQQQQKGMTVFLGVEQALGGASVLEIDTEMSTISDTPPDVGGRKRSGDGVVVERRQKRMIKNRESAARSQARKQAYTHELENKVSRLEEEIERLRRHEEVEKVLPSAAPPSEPNNHLPRTGSSPFLTHLFLVFAKTN